ncbi:MAG: hypothetical protein LQ343_005331 [Gyalolechia ehrenbergii]|nr:MAG: hypothetical protein LQ343_005331 [Gyalolechia ehrenbergii]
MAAKAAKAAFSGAHTAGIYADMTVDGPEIGTLVVIVDRAKNLPNRKTMGKQDPYCAARLGKEAKKTETDKRGGQTPKWDQELRFTVHESPDYYQLKVSVFNDDKRTELIGETRIGLEDIIVLGGGQNDTWHNLYCKGRFAGEIRIELTYYDTRPKEEKLPDRQSEPAENATQEPGRDTVGGPRGPKPVKRRPLPANPTGIVRPAMPDHSHSAPLPQPTHQIIHHPTPSYPDRQGHRIESTPPSTSRHEHGTQPGNIGSPNGYEGYGQQWTDSQRINAHNHEHHAEEDHTYKTAFDLPGQHPYNRHHEQYAPRQTYQDIHRPVDLDDPYVGAHQPSNHHASLPNSASYDHIYPSVDRRVPTSYDFPYSSSPPAISHGNSMPDVRPYNHSRSIDHKAQRHSLPNVRGHPEQSPTQQPYLNGYSQDYAYQQPSIPDDNDVPPPPPVHRTNSGVSPSPLGNGPSLSESRVPIPGTAPLNVRKERGSFSNSPLSQVQNSVPHSEYAPSTSPSHIQHHGHSPAMATVRQGEASPSAWDAYHRRSISPTRNGQPMPSSLVPGQAPDSSQHMPSNRVYDSRMRYKQAGDRETAPQYQQVQAPTVQSRFQHAPTINAQSPLQALERGPDRRPHRASAPVAPQVACPDPRIPPRKSVSPRPEPGSIDRRGSDIPFSPDSYEAFNPFVGSNSAGVSPGARYDTPEQAREASIQHEREQRLGDGPIIGSDGRVIDPSDHLPTETWAPEPEAKAPRKTAQVNIRFRNSPQGAQPMPRSSPRVPHDASTRPTAISTPPYNQDSNSTPDTISPVTAARARLQKKTRLSPAHPNSSPAVPMVNTALQNPVLRTTASDYPLREHESYGYGSSPTYNRPSPTGIPPPVPGKVPIGMGQEDWRRDPLSEELSRIDIGVGGGRMRRNRYGG